MNKKLLVSILSVGIAVLGFVYYLSLKQSEEKIMPKDSDLSKSELMMESDKKDTNTKMTEEVMEISEKDMTDKDTAMNDNVDSGNYLNYTPENFNKFSDKRRVLFFYANWCPTCAPTDKDFSGNSSLLPSDVVVIRVNYNDTDTDQNEKELAVKYGVTYQHTFVQINSEGTEVTKWNGGKISELLAKIK